MTGDCRVCLPCPEPYSLMEYTDEVDDALDEYLFGDAGLTSMRLNLLEDTGLLHSFLLVQHESSLVGCDYCDGSSHWGQVRMFLYRVFLGIGSMVSDAFRDVSVYMLDLGDLWLHCEPDELYIAGVHGFISLVVQTLTGPILGRVIWILVAILSWLGIGRCVGMSCWPRGSMCCFVSD